MGKGSKKKHAHDPEKSHSSLLPIRMAAAPR